MSIKIIQRKIEKQHDSFVRWKIENGFAIDYSKKISDSYYNMKTGFPIIGAVLSYALIFIYFFHSFIFPVSAEPNSLLVILFCLSLLIVAGLTHFVVSSKITKRVNKDMEKLISESKLYEVCYQTTSSDFDSLPIDLEMRNLLKFTLNNQEWEALHFYTKDKINYGNLKEFINYYSEKNVNASDIESDKYIIELGPLYK